MTHWFLVGVAPGCDASIGQIFTAEPDKVTCPACLAYVKVQAALHGTTIESVGQSVRAVQ